MRSTSRASILRWKAPHWDEERPSACMRASPGFGKTWSAVVVASGSTFIRCCRAPFRTSSAKCHSETFYRAINRVERSLIRTDADEVTYNLHIMMRFGLELELLEGRLRAKDLSEAWRAGMQAYLGIVPTDDRDGCLQDVHWYAGGIGGGFQSYTIGNILSAQFYAAAVKAHPNIPSEIAIGEFSTLHAWLREHLYQHGRKFKPYELVERTTGGQMSIRPYLAYLRAKYGELYQLPPVEMTGRSVEGHT